MPELFWQRHLRAEHSGRLTTGQHGAPPGADFLAGGSEGGVFVSGDNGLSWTEVGQTLPLSEVGAVIGHPSGKLFAGTDGLGLFVTSNGGTTWDTAFTWSSYVKVLASNATHTMFAGTLFDGVLRSVDAGVTWIPANDGMLTTNISAIAIAPSGEMYAGTDAGVYRSTDDGAHWSDFSSGLLRPLVLSLTFDGNGYLYAGTFGTGVFRTTRPTGAATSGDPIPGAITLGQNFPNPFNSSTVVEYTLPAGAARSVSLRVFDILGREVATLIHDEVRSPGTYRVGFDAGHLASGVYFYQLRSGTVVRTKSLLLLR
jgi:hypothetical protein